MKFNYLIVILIVLVTGAAFAESEASIRSTAKKRANQLMEITGDSDYSEERAAWDKTYQRMDYVFGKDPSLFLVQQIDKIPKGGKALDIATGEGRNAVFLAKKGFTVEGVDISNVGLKKAQKLAAENGVKIQTTNADLTRYKIKKKYYDVILNFLYLQRSLFPQIKEGLKPGGYFIFESYSIDQLKNKSDESWEKSHLLNLGELKKEFADFDVKFYQESNDGKDALVRMVARKR